MIYSVMRNFSLGLVLLPLISLTGCRQDLNMAMYDHVESSMTNKREGTLTWDYEQHEMYQATSIHDVVGAALGSFTTSRYRRRSDDEIRWLVYFNKLIRDKMESGHSGIALTPSEVHSVVIQSLSPATNVSTYRSPMYATTALPDTEEPDVAQWRVHNSTSEEITTDWKRVSGKRAGILWWEKQYETQVSHVITIKPSLDSHILTGITVTTTIRERPNENYEWGPGNVELARKEHAAIKAHLVIAILRKMSIEHGVEQGRPAKEILDKLRK